MVDSRRVFNSISCKASNVLTTVKYALGCVLKNLRCPFKILSLYFLGGTEENHEKSQSVQLPDG